MTIVDDVPSIEPSNVSTSTRPGDAGNNLQKGNEIISFLYDEDGEPLKGDNVQTSWWDGNVKISATKVTYDYDQKDEWGNTKITGEDPTGMALSYSSYNGATKQYYKEGVIPPEEEQNVTAFHDEGGWYRYAPVSDWGLAVTGGENPGEIQASGNTSEAVVIDLEGYAYGMTINFGAFFAGKANEDDPAAGTGYDTKSEKALITFYKDGNPVYSTIEEGTNSGEFVYNTGEVLLDGFDRVVISAVNNTENSDFTIQGFDFVTKRDDPIIVNGGTVTADSGADGFAEEYQESNVKFDLGSMVQEGTLNDKGTSGTITVLIKGEPLEVTLELSEGSSGESILTGTIKGTNEQLFTATLDQEGHWTMEQYEHFRVPGEGNQSSNEFELVFKTEDSDGDIASTTVNVPLEVKEQSTNDAGKSIGNSDDIISITSSVDDGVAGTVVAGDTGGMTEGTVVEKNYNICFVLDQSNGMFDNYIDGEGSRFEVARNSIINFIDTQILDNKDFSGDVEISVIPFHSWSGEPITLTIKDGNIINNEYSFFKQLESLKKPSENGWPQPGGTNYEAGFTAAAEWFRDTATSNDLSNVETENITYFLSDGEPTFHGTSTQGGGNHATKPDVEGAWKGYQKLLNSASDMQVNAIGFGNLSDEAMWTLAMLDNTGTPAEGVAGNMSANGKLYYEDGYIEPKVAEYTAYEGVPSRDDWETYYIQLENGTYEQLEWQSQWPDFNWELGYYEDHHWVSVGSDDTIYTIEYISVSYNGNATKVTNGQSLTAAFESGFRPGTLDGAGSDTITAAESTSSVIVFGDVMNTDQLLHDLNDAQLNGAAPLPDYGSGKEVFQWLETNGSYLQGTQFDGWTHDDSIKYMLQHAEELGCETRVDGNGTTYLVTVNGTVLNLDGSEAQGVALETLTGRDGGNDTITGSSASDTIYGQEGNDLLVGDPSDDSEGLTDVSVSDLKEMQPTNPEQFENFLSRVEGTESDGDDMLFGGTGDDVLIGMGGNDYLNGGHGEDAIFGGSGDDIVVYDKNDFLVDGGQGIDFMVSDKTELSLQGILDNTDTDDGPLVNNIDVLITGKDALSLTSIDQLAADYGITLGTNSEGKETLSLDDRWMPKDGAEDTFTFTGKDGVDLTLQTVLTPQSNGDAEQHVFILNNANG